MAELQRQLRELEERNDSESSESESSSDDTIDREIGKLMEEDSSSDESVSSRTRAQSRKVLTTSKKAVNSSNNFIPISPVDTWRLNKNLSGNNSGTNPFVYTIRKEKDPNKGNCFTLPTQFLYP